jgi:protease I
MAKELTGKKVAIVVTDGFEQVELEKPKQALEEAGAKAEIVSPKPDKVKGWKFTEWGTEFKVDKADPNDYDALVLPGGR